MNVLSLIGGVCAIIGALFHLFGAIGLLRMPDAFNRIQAGTKATTLGTILFLIGVGLYQPTWLPKLLLLIIFVLLTNPVSSHVLARAAHHIGQVMSPKTSIDHLSQAEGEGGRDA